VEKLLRGVVFASAVGVLVCFPLIALNWSSGVIQAVQSVICLLAIVLAAIYLVFFRKGPSASRRAVWGILVTTSIFLALEVAGAIIVSVPLH
jgi:hypothetical protein